MLKSEYKIRSATESDLPQIMSVFENARAFLKLQGVNQWQDGYPEEQDIIKDIENKNTYVLTTENRIIATFAFVHEREPDYETVYDGAFRADGDYASIHRVAVSEECRGKGIGSLIVGFAKTCAIENGYSSLRCDTHHDNKPMQRMLTKNGFVPCGTIYLKTKDDLHKRLAFDMLLSDADKLS